MYVNYRLNKHRYTVTFGIIMNEIRTLADFKREIIT